jgi:SEC-C motif
VKRRGFDMQQLGSSHRPVIVKVNSEMKAQRVAEICEEYDFQYIAGIEVDEDITDLKKAIQQRNTPTNAYVPCPCGSGKKYKFCCAKKPLELDI